MHERVILDKIFRICMGTWNWNANSIRLLADVVSSGLEWQWQRHSKTDAGNVSLFDENLAVNVFRDDKSGRC
jgi:hypothetical protein